MAYGALSSRAIIGRFYQGYDGAVGGSWAPGLSFYSSSNQESETYKMLGLPPQLREWVGDRLEEAFHVYSLTIQNKVYEQTIPIDVDELRRDKTGQIMLRVGQAAQRAAEHWEKLLTTMIESGSGAGPTCFDTATFFSTSHSTDDSGTQENDLDSSDVAALNVTTAAAPTRDECIDIIIGLVEYMMTYKDDQGEPINGGAKEFAIMCPVKMMGEFSAAVNGDLVLAGARNPLSAQDFRCRVIPNPRLTQSNNIVFLFRTDGIAKPFIMQEELPLQAQYIGAGSEEEFKNNRHLFGAKAIRNVGPGLWQYAIKATLS